MSKIGPFIFGATIGAVAALMLAPQTGEKTRAFVAEKANAVASEAKDFGAGLPGSAVDAFKGATSKGQDLVADAQSRVKEASGQPAEIDSDDLREKIEAARKRIAAQVMENAEQGQAVDVATEPEEAQEVQETAENAE